MPAGVATAWPAATKLYQPTRIDLCDERRIPSPLRVDALKRALKHSRLYCHLRRLGTKEPEEPDMWLVQVGEHTDKDQLLVDLRTDVARR